MSMDTFLQIQRCLEWFALAATAIAGGYLVAAVVGWRGPHRKKRFVRFALFLGVVTLCIAAHVGILQEVLLPTLAANADVQSQEKIIELTHARVGDQAPLIAVARFGGEQFTLADHRGQVTLVNFFETSCPHSRKTLPHLQTIWDEHSENSDFAMIAIGRGERLEAVQEFGRENGFTFPMAADPDRAAFSAYADRLIPRTFLISKEGMICFSATGYYKEDMESLQRELPRQLELTH